jgi:hypothetical protein
MRDSGTSGYAAPTTGKAGRMLPAVVAVEPSSTCRARFYGGKVYAGCCSLLQAVIRVQSRAYYDRAVESRHSSAQG